MKRLLAGAFLLLAAACSGSGGGSGGGGGGGPLRPPGPGGQPPDNRTPVPPTAAAPTERECDALVAHAIALRVAELAQTLPAEQVPTEAEQAALGAELRGQFLADCRRGTRRGYDCAIAAKTLAELGGCQARPRSSTSNSSVAPPGILPPAAPRSP
ncbi:MAG TPA: hypothetical protein VNO30_41975 [Kofleriaceae bacterium]|nr:hypothetical protein [Kofleriaceae bacterium]